MFVAGMSKIEEPPFNDIWTVPGDSDLREDWEKADGERFAEVDPISIATDCKSRISWIAL